MSWRSLFKNPFNPSEGRNTNKLSVSLFPETTGVNTPILKVVCYPNSKDKPVIPFIEVRLSLNVPWTQVSIEEEPRILEGTGLPPSMFHSLKCWINLNRPTLLDFWYAEGLEEAGKFLGKSNLKKLQG